MVVKYVGPAHRIVRTSIQMGTTQMHAVLLVDQAKRSRFHPELFLRHCDAVAAAKLLDPSDWLVYSGSPEVLTQLNRSLMASYPSRMYKHEAVASITTTFHGVVRLTLERRDLYAQATPQDTRPGVGVYPKNLSPQGKPVWDKLLQTQRMRDNLAGQSDRAAWAIAVQLYFNKMLRLNLPPYADDARQSYLPQHQHGQELKQKSVQQIFLARSFVEQLHKNLRSRQFVPEASSRWALRDVIYANNKYNVAMFKSVPLNRTVTADMALQYLTNDEGFSPYGSMRNTVAYRLSDFGFMLITASDSPKRMEFNLVISFHRSFLEANMGLRKNSVDKDGLLVRLKQYAQEHLLSDADYVL